MKKQLFADQVLRVIRLKGYSDYNPARSYKEGKHPVDKGWANSPNKWLTPPEVEDWQQQGGWAGLIIPKGYILVDVDDKDEGRLLLRVLTELRLDFHVIETPNGFQFFFKDTGRIQKQSVKAVTEVGFCVDYRLAGKGYIVLPGPATDGRKWIWENPRALSILPDWLHPLGEREAPFQLPVGEGGRNDTLFRHGCRLKSMGKSTDEIKGLLTFVNRHLAKAILHDIPCFTYNGKLYAYSKGVYHADGQALIEKTANSSLEINPPATKSMK